MRASILLVLIFFELLSFGQKKQVCFSFDDLPNVNYGITDSVFQKNLINKLILSLKTYSIPAIGFVNEKKLYDKNGIIQLQVEMLNNWVNSGMELGNHTFSHPNYNDLTFKEFSLDILKGETVTKKILERNGKTIKYFRHPYLHVGNTKSKADSLDNFLTENGYLVAPVTIDNDDYLFAVAYHRAKVKKDTNLALQVGHDYIVYMEKKLKYYEEEAQNLFGRNINQILLLHASLLNSDYIDSLAIMFKINNYCFVNMGKALEDEVYKSNITVYVDLGLSWIDRWALSQDKKGDFFKRDPVPPDYIKKLAE